METNIILSPPWYTFMNEVKHTIGADNTVDVCDLITTTSPFQLPIIVHENAEKAQALANILKSGITIGNVAIVVLVYADGVLVQPKAPESAEDLFGITKVALADNPLCTAVEAAPMFPFGPEIVWPIFSKSIIQFFNDDLSDYYNDYNEVTAKVFEKILNLSPGGFYLHPSTAK